MLKVYADGTGDQAAGGNPGDVYGSNQVIAQVDLLAVTGNMTATAGYAFVGATRSSATAGAGQGLTIGRIYKDTALIAFGKVDVTAGGAGPSALVWGVNVSAVAWQAVGRTRITLVNGAANHLAIIATAYGTSCAAYAGPLSTSSFDVYTDATGGGAATDCDFYFAVYGG